MAEITYPSRARSFSSDASIGFIAEDDAYHNYDILVGSSDKIPGVLTRLEFQAGPLPEYGINGLTNEAVLQVLIDRTAKMDELFPCAENKQAIAAMENALGFFNIRTERRKAAGIEGKHEEASNV